MAKSTGEIAKTIGIETRVCGIKASESIAKGDIVTWDTSNDLLKATAGTTTISDGFGVALEASTSGSNSQSGSPRNGTAFLNVAVGNTYVYVEAGADIDALDLVKMQDTQELELHSAPTAANSTHSGTIINGIKDWFGFTVGRAFGKEGDTDDFSVAANGETFIVRLGL